MSGMKSFLYVLGGAALAGAVVLGAPAVGQGSGLGLQNHNTNAPVTVASDRIEVEDRVDRATFSGNVQVRQANLSLASSRLTIAYSQRGGIEIERIDASGGVILTSPTERASSRFAIYDIEQRIITMLGDVTLTRGESRVNGARLIIDLTTGRAVMDGGGPAGTRNEGGRVTGTFTVPQRKS